MASRRVILFVCAGRRPNMELQLPLVARIIEENPTVEYHVWNFSRTDSDRRYVASIQGPRTTVFNQYGAMAHNEAYRTYSGTDYRDSLFIKIDDDIVFMETGRFPKFVDAIAAHPGTVVSANIVNNGACAPLQPGIWDGFTALDTHLLDIHIGDEFAELAHTHMAYRWGNMIGEDIRLIPTQDWLSVNLIGYDWRTMGRLIETIGTAHPAVVADRPMDGWGGRQGIDRPYGSFGDEGVFNIMPKIIMQGFLAAHLSYGAQNPSPEQYERWRNNYQRIGQRYLADPPQYDDPPGLPELSAVSHAQTPGYVPPRPASQPASPPGAPRRVVRQGGVARLV